MVKIDGIEIVLNRAREVLTEILETIPETPYDSQLWESDSVMDSESYDVAIDGKFYTVNKGVGEQEVRQFSTMTIVDSKNTLFADVILNPENFGIFAEAHELCCK